ncbi:MAG: hypothetical protein ABSG33_00260 [Candidatus Bathyarchaeia archaeon]
MIQALNQKINPKQALHEASCRLAELPKTGINGFIPAFSRRSLFSAQEKEFFRA